ncbi:hypothetical protein ARD30_09165 [Bosea thiooxidans]|uniref:RSAM-associated Gly-rich repeat protein n=1 Tax=Bosea thiooxidans TaxID=53254 RepID=A0A0Q3KPJ7_9HYPH|nr:hypothetical protein [Bosea thiooxidans]KQK31635.1 hypothetical protein ARD30_09165 [Bosea thiooxidans]SKB66175.1 hypothetical protein SAMN05660750_01696 [Bosea thiooxidans]
MRRLVIAAALVASAATATVLHTPTALASEALAPAVAQQLDGLPAAFTASAAKRERMMIIQQNLERQRYGRGGYGYDRGYGYGYGRGYGYGPRYGGPPPWAPAHGYRRHYYDRW